MDTERLKERRLSKHLMQKELSEKLGISPERYNQYETGKREPDNRMLVRIAEALETSSDYLLGISANPDMSNTPESKNTWNQSIIDLSELSEKSRADLIKQMNLLKLRDRARANNEFSEELRPNLN